MSEIPESIIIDAQWQIYEVQTECKDLEGLLESEKKNLALMISKKHACEKKLADYCRFLTEHGDDTTDWYAEVGLACPDFDHSDQ